MTACHFVPGAKEDSFHAELNGSFETIALEREQSLEGSDKSGKFWRGDKLFNTRQKIRTCFITILYLFV